MRACSGVLGVVWAGWLAVIAGSCLLLLLVGSGCASSAERGYVFGGGFSGDVETVAVPIFRNETFERGIEGLVTEALVKEIESSTPWRVVGRGVADTEIRGTVTGYGLEGLATDSETGLGSQMAVVVTVSFEWADRRTGEVLVSRRNYRGSDFFVPSRGAREPIEAGRSGAVGRVVRGMVGELRGSW